MRFWIVWSREREGECREMRAEGVRLGKAAGDCLVRARHHTFGLPVFATNGSNDYDAWPFPEKLIRLSIHWAWAGEPLPIYGDGRQIRDWLYVGDHCAVSAACGRRAIRASDNSAGILNMAIGRRT